MQHRRRQHIFQAAKRVHFNQKLKTDAARTEKIIASQAASGR